MTETRRSLRQRLQQMGPLTRAAVLVGALGAATLLVLPFAFAYSGWLGLAACWAAFALCALPAVLSLLIGELLSGPQRALNALLLGMLLRMGMPLAGCVAAFVLNSPLVDAGLPFYLLVLYPIMLTTETVLMTASLESASSPQAARDGNPKLREAP